MSSVLTRYNELQAKVKTSREQRARALNRDTTRSIAAGLASLVIAFVVLYLTKNFGLHSESYAPGEEGVPVSIFLAAGFGVVGAGVFYNIFGKVRTWDRELDALSYELREASDEYLEEAVAGKIVRLHDYGIYRLGHYEKISMDFGDAVRTIYARLSSDGTLDWRLKK